MGNGGDLIADLTGYTGDQSDRFSVEVTTSGMNMISFRAANGMYLSTSSEIDTLAANSATAGTREKFQWIELLTGPVVMRSCGGGGHLIQSKTGGIFPSADNGLQSLQHYTFDNGSSPLGPPLLPTTLPSPWTTADIGAVGAVGSAIYRSGVFTVAGSGADIESISDGFQYVYQAANGDVTIEARIATQQNTDYWAKTGVMIRDGTSAGFINVAVLMTAQGGVTFQRRTSTGGSTAVNVKSGVTVPEWVKLVRSGNSFSAYHSADGVSWMQIASSQIVVMTANVILGLAVSSHQSSTLCESTLDNVIVATTTASPTGRPSSRTPTTSRPSTLTPTTRAPTSRKPTNPTSKPTTARPTTRAPTAN
ncbi:hypothetical protein ACHAW5_008678 [Stephanodiscus triporus]|uniref:Uncharacterized protein n=1 Tax=Stephanodiscus triporus TaxID=2934178 RepID=A0ABD3QP34_9STRA